jgi:hypothetical protein
VAAAIQQQGEASNIAAMVERTAQASEEASAAAQNTAQNAAQLDALARCKAIFWIATRFNLPPAPPSALALATAPRPAIQAGGSGFGIDHRTEGAALISRLVGCRYRGRRCAGGRLTVGAVGFGGIAVVAADGEIGMAMAVDSCKG